MDLLRNVGEPMGVSCLGDRWRPSIYVRPLGGEQA